MAPPALTITVALDMSKAFDTINIHTLIRKLLQTNIPGTIIKFIANYINGHAKPTQHIETIHPDNVNLKLAFHKAASFHPHYLTFTPQTCHHPVHRFRSWPSQMTSPSHPHTQARVQPRNIYNHTYRKFFLDNTKQSHTKSRQSNLHSVNARPCIIYEQSGPKIHNNALPMATHPNVMGLALDPKLTYSTHIHTLEYASSVWSLLASSTSINKLQVMQNAALRTATGCTQDTNIQHLHDETLTLPINEHLQSTPNHIHHHYAPSATPSHTTHTISSSAPTYAPHCHTWICGQTPLEWWSCWPDGEISWLVDQKREDRTHPPPPQTRVKGVGRHNNKVHNVDLFQSLDNLKSQLASVVF